jgi:aminopeptidase N
VDTTYPKLENLLNANSYQKGSWVLHMLHHYLGDTVFRDCIRSYYEHYRLSNASTKDLQQDFERVSGQDLDWFFDQWLYNEGHPVLSVGIKRSGGRSILFIDQTQSGRSFIFPLRIRFVLKNGEDIVKDFQINEREQEFVLDIKGKITGFEADPETDLLFELKK